MLIGLSWWVHFVVIKSYLHTTIYGALLFYVSRFEEGNISHYTTITFGKALWSALCRCSENKGLSNFPLFFNWETENKMPHWLPLLPKIHLRDLSKTIVWIQQAIYFLVDHLQFAQYTLISLTLYPIPPQQTLLGITQVLEQMSSCPKVRRTRAF